MSDSCPSTIRQAALFLTLFALREKQAWVSIQETTVLLVSMAPIREGKKRKRMSNTWKYAQLAEPSSLFSFPSAERKAQPTAGNIPMPCWAPLKTLLVGCDGKWSTFLMEFPRQGFRGCRCGGLQLQSHLLSRTSHELRHWPSILPTALLLQTLTAQPLTITYTVYIRSW